MPLKTQIMDDVKTSMKSGEKTKLSVLRMIQSAVKNKEIDNRVKEADPNDKRTQDERDDEMVQGILRTLVKQRKESIEQFTQGGRQDLVDQELSELKIIEAYLPQMMGEAELAKIVDEAILSTKATSPKDMGLVMKAVIAKSAGRADGKLINELVKAKLLK